MPATRPRAQPAWRSQLKQHKPFAGRATTTGRSSSTLGHDGKPKGALLTHANCFWTNLSFDLATASPATTSCSRAAAVPPRVAPVPPLAWWKGAMGAARAAVRRPRARAHRREAGDDDDGRAGELPLHGAGAGLAQADFEPAARRRGRGADAQPARDVQERGVEIVQGYGLTEAAPNVLCCRPRTQSASAASRQGLSARRRRVARPRVGPARRRVREGELVVRGPNVFAGYWRNVEATEAVLEHGWLHTGDVAFRDEEGYYRIVGRTKDMIISGGENVYPAEIENVLHAASRRARRRSSAFPTSAGARRASPSSSSQERRPRRSWSSTAAALARALHTPKSVRFVESLPRNALDKVVKSDLVELVR